MSVDGIIMIVAGLFSLWLAYGRVDFSPKPSVHAPAQTRSFETHRKSGKWLGPCLIITGLFIGFRKDGGITFPGASPTMNVNGVAVTVHRENAGTPNASGWYPAESTEGVTRIRFPGPFLDVTGVPATRSKPKFYGMVCETEDGLVFTVNEYIPRYGYQIRSPDELITRRAKTVANERLPVQLAGYDAQAFSYELEDGGLGIFRYIKLADRVVLLEVESPIEKEAQALQSSREFFDSFRVRRTDSD
jgi:hypothetical protein